MSFTLAQRPAVTLLSDGVAHLATQAAVADPLLTRHGLA
jgi:hypothetical protein